MPERRAKQRATEDRRQGKSPSTQAGEFVREEIEHVRHGVHGARSAKQAIAIGLSKARRAGVALPPPKEGTTSRKTRRSAERAYEAGQEGRAKRKNPRRSRAIKGALKRERRAAGTKRSLARQASSAARRRGPSARSQAGRKAARTKGAAARSAAAKKAARTRKRRARRRS